jgi:Skp family chaperone for outer membrane proteins
MNLKSMIIITLLAVGLFGYSEYQQKKSRTCFYNKVRVFNEYHYKKELVIELEKIHKRHTMELDSLQAELYVIKKQANHLTDPNEIILRETALSEKQERYSAEENELMNSYDKRIFNQLRVRIEEYCKENNIASLIAYDKESIDVIIIENDLTEEVLNYINK